MKTIKYMQRFFLAVAFTAGLTACSSEEDFVTTSTSEAMDVDLVIGAFPTFSENTVSRAIGTEDPGKTAWTSGDVVLLKTTFFSDGEKSTQLSTTTNKLTFDGSKWTLNSRIYWPDAAVAATIKAWYAPNYELNQSGTLTLKSGESAGTCEMLTSEEIGVMKEDMKATIAFQGRTYSLLRVATDPGRTLKISSSAFTAPDGTTPIASGLEVTADAQGNILLYGTWTSNAKLTVKVEDNGKAYTLIEKDMSASAAGKSYATDAIMNTATDCSKWGSGTAESPYLIASAAQLADVGTKVDYYYNWKKYFLQIADIDLSSVCSQESNKSWTPIGMQKRFKGVYDGGNHSISNLYINTNQTYCGLFSYISDDNAIVKNVRLISGSVISTADFVGGIAGFNYMGTIANCSNAASIVSTGNKCGGIAGTNDVTIVGCSNTGSVTGATLVGGITGEQSKDAVMVGCSNTGNVKNTSYGAGGLIGWLNNCSNVFGCFTTGTVSGSDDFGSVIGRSLSGAVNNIYYVSQEGINWYGNYQATSMTDVIAKTLAEMNETATVNSLNAAINAWNTANTDKPCNYHFEVGTGIATLPIIVEGAPQ